MCRHVLLKNLSGSGEGMTELGVSGGSGDAQNTRSTRTAHLLVGGDLALEKDEEPAVTEEVVGAPLCLLHKGTSNNYVSASKAEQQC